MDGPPRSGRRRRSRLRTQTEVTKRAFPPEPRTLARLARPAPSPACRRARRPERGDRIPTAGTAPTPRFERPGRSPRRSPVRVVGDGRVGME